MRSGGGGGGCSWLGNAREVNGVRSDSLKVGWIFQLTGSSRVYAEAPFLALILKGPIRLSSSFFFGQGRWRFVVSSQTLLPILYSMAGRFFLLYCTFICRAAFSSDFLAVAWTSCILETKVSEAGVRKGTVDFAPGNMSGL